MRPRTNPSCNHSLDGRRTVCIARQTALDCWSLVTASEINRTSSTLFITPQSNQANSSVNTQTLYYTTAKIRSGFRVDFGWRPIQLKIDQYLHTIRALSYSWSLLHQFIFLISRKHLYVRQRRCSESEMPLCFCKSFFTFLSVALLLTSCKRLSRNFYTSVHDV